MPYRQHLKGFKWEKLTKILKHKIQKLKYKIKSMFFKITKAMGKDLHLT